MWQMNSITEDEIMAECGMDSVCILRLLMMGYKICLLSMLNAIWLMPLYATAKSDTNITDPVVSLTIAKVSSGSPRLIGTVLATYVLFGYVMYLILKEFEWFIEMRHKYLRRPVVENYAVYVRNIPPEYCSNTALYHYFASCFPDDKVLETKVRIKLPSLINAVKSRETVLKKFEHAINYQDVKNKAPTHRVVNLLRPETVESIPFYAKTLRDLNRDITNQIDAVQLNIITHGTERIDYANNMTIDSAHGSNSDLRPLTDANISSQFGTFSTRDDPSIQSMQSSKSRSTTRFAAAKQSNTNMQVVADDEFDVDGTEGPIRLENSIRQGLVNTTKTLSIASKAAAGTTLSMALSATNTASKMLSIRAEGEYYNAGFVTFRCLGTTQAVLQMVHHQTPFDMEVLDAPRPDDIFWTNVGRSHYDLQVGQLLSLASTIALCLLWTIPITFIASLSSVEAISTQIPVLGKLIEKSPFIGKLFEILAPLLVKVVNGLLPVILEYLTKFEGPVSGSIIVASLFTKLAAFMIIQTFFVSAVGSSILQGKLIVRNVTGQCFLSNAMIKKLLLSHRDRSSYREPNVNCKNPCHFFAISGTFRYSLW
jgi:Calcium-dependent channel, 7TM region, putative phosphate/Late exocytosis, associated with Golgi transport/Cytosolic domain of 10TM putative phosphate transporter